MQEADVILEAVLQKTHFWRQWAGTPLNARQIKVLNRMLDGFVGKLTNKKWAALCKCSSDTALRDISDFLALGVLRKTAPSGRSTSYELSRLGQRN